MLQRLVILLVTIPAAAFAQTNCATETPRGTGTTYQISSSSQLANLPVLKPGDNVLLRRGTTFFTSATVQVRQSGISTRPILFGAYGSGSRPVLDGSRQSTRYHYGINAAGRSWVTIDGLEIRNYGVPVHIHGSQQIKVRRSLIHHARATCNKISGGSSDITLEGNRIHTCGTTSNGEGIYVGTDPANTSTEDVVSRVILRRNTIFNLNHEGIELKPGVRNAVVDSNRIDDVDIGIHASHWSSSSYQNRHLITKNLLSRLTNRGMVVKTGAEIWKNVVSGVTGTNGIQVFDSSGSGQRIDLHHNTVYNTPAPGISIGNGPITNTANLVYRTGGGNFSRDPLFVNPSAMDFRLRSGSPAAGLGAYGVGEALWPVGHTGCHP
jgi:Right handed beta helix region